MEAKRRLSKRARGTLIWGLAWFIAGQIFCGFALRSRPELADREFGRKVADLRRLRAQVPDRPLFLMLGSSRVATGFRPDAFPSSVREGSVRPLIYNFAQVGSGPEMSHLSLYRLLEAKIRPDWVFIEYWAPTWTTERNLKEFSDQINIGCLGWSDVGVLSSYVKPNRRGFLFKQWLGKQFVPLYANRSTILENLAPRWMVPPPTPDHRCQNLDTLGWWSPRTSVSPEERQVLSERYSKHYGKRLRSYHTAENPDHALRAMLSLCRREKIRATVVILPEANDFREVYARETTEKAGAYLDIIRREFDVNVVDARTWVADEDFMDGHHLLPSGALVFSKRLESQVVQPLMAGSERGPRR